MKFTYHLLSFIIFISLHISGGLGACSAAASKVNKEEGLLPIKSPKPKISRLELDTLVYQVSYFSVGLQDFIMSQAPKITIDSPPINADYFQVMRCDTETLIKGLSNDPDLDHIKFDMNTKTGLENLFKTNDYWSIAQEIKTHCIMVAENLTGTSLMDMRAPTGNYKYLIRACVDPSRIVDADNLGSRNCSRMVNISKLDAEYINRREALEQRALSDVQSEIDTMDALGREVYYEATAYWNALNKCESVEVQRQIRVKKRQAYATIAGVGVSLGLNILSSYYSASSLAKEGTAAAATEKTTMQKVEDYWSKANSSMGSSNAIASALLNLTDSDANYKRECYEADKWNEMLTVKVLELKAQDTKVRLAINSTSCMIEYNKAMKKGESTSAFNCTGESSQ